MRWDRLFEDLETQLASEWESERAALESEAERLRLSKLSLRERLQVFAEGEGTPVAARSRSGDVFTGRVVTVGADFAALRTEAAHAGGLVLLPLHAPWEFALPAEELLRSARGSRVPASPLAERMTLGFVLRDVARKRLAVGLVSAGGMRLHGTIDRVGADHLDLAEHEPGAPRRPENVRAHRLISFEMVESVRVEAPRDYAFG